MPKAPVKLDWIAPPADLVDLVHTFYVATVGPGAIDEPTPAYSAQLVMVVDGIAELEFSHGGIAQIGPLFLNAPQLRSGRIRLAGPFRAIGASLTPLGWAALTAHDADTVHDRAVALDPFVAPGLQRDIADWTNRAKSDQADLKSGIAYLDAILRSAQHPIKDRHREFVQAVAGWLGSQLNPSLEDLYRNVPLSTRHIQRLCRQFFGASPTQVLMRHRAIRTAMLFSNPDLSQSLRDELTAAYFDQAHMIRDIRRFTGRTPADFADRSFAQESLDPAGHGETAAVLLDGGQPLSGANDSQQAGLR